MTDSGLQPGDKYILLVEDNLDDSELTLRALKRHRIGNKIIHVRDGVEALDFLFARETYSDRDRSHVPSLVLLDISMPRLSGHDVLKAMREEPVTQMVPVVMLTSSDEQTDVVRAYGGGVNSYVRKPIEFADFLGAVGQLGVYWMLHNLSADQPGGSYGGG